MLAAFAGAGLWPGLDGTLAAALEDASILHPEDVLPSRLRLLPAVSAARADRLAASFAGVEASYAVAVLLVPAGLPVRLAGAAVRHLGREAAGRLTRDPWRLLDLPDVRLADADKLARSVLDAAASPTDPRRGAALVAHVLVRAARDGHTCLPLDVVASAVQGEGFADVAGALAAAADADRVVRGQDGALALVRYAVAEEAVAEGVARLTALAEPGADPDTAGGLDAGGPDAGGPDAGGLDAGGPDGLDARQRAAVAAALRHGVSVLTGGPGTGKGRTVAALVALATARGQTVALAAPTGRAAKRLEELCSAPAVPLHRLLGAKGTGGTFTRGEDRPLDADLVVVDEAARLDVELAAALLTACADGSHLLLVGDPAQLPTTGPGRVLGDLVDSGVVPVTELTTLHHRSGAIARLAAAVRGGSLPALAPDPAHEVVLVPTATSAEAAHRTVQLVSDSIPRALRIASAEVQVVTPVHRGDAGTVALNAALKAALNPGEGEVGGFDVGDRVVALAGSPGLGYAEGEVGLVTGVEDGGLVVTFPGTGPVTVPAVALADLAPGWAVTVHRAQGSRFAAVVVVLPAEGGGLLSRPLVYTAFTRAERHLSVVYAAGPALARAVREVGPRPRRTRLAALVKDELAQL